MLFCNRGFAPGLKAALSKREGQQARAPRVPRHRPLQSPLALPCRRAAPRPAPGEPGEPPGVPAAAAGHPPAQSGAFGAAEDFLGLCPGIKEIAAPARCCRGSGGAGGVSRGRRQLNPTAAPWAHQQPRLGDSPGSAVLRQPLAALACPDHGRCLSSSPEGAVQVHVYPLSPGAGRCRAVPLPGPATLALSQPATELPGVTRPP